MSDKPEPEANVCEFCGKKLPYKALLILNEYLQWLPTLCDCKKAIAWRKEQDEAEQLRIKEEQERKEQSEKLERIKELLGSSGIQKRLEGYTLKNFIITAQNSKALGVVKAYLANYAKYFNKGQGLYIEGTVGAGKTHLAVAIGLYLLEKGIPVVFRTFSELLAELRKTYNPKSAILEEEIMSVFTSVDLLIIDDLGKEKPSEWTLDRLYYIINSRYNDMRPTIITANYNREDLIRRLNPKGEDGKTAEAIVSRLQETTAIITMTGENWRLKNEV